MTEDELLKKRFSELSDRALSRNIYVFSDFLSLYEQSLVNDAVKYGVGFFGGYENAERNIAVFGNENDIGYEPEIPVKCIRISPLSQKFSDDLTHRDFLGSLMNLGIKRETLGDIIISENSGYLFCLERVACYICDNLIKVRHTSVRAELCPAMPKGAEAEPTPKIITVSSERADVLISAVYNISRSKSAALVEAEKVFINGKLVRSPAVIPKDDDIISVRGTGRFRYCGIEGKTKKGKLRIKAEVF